MHELLYYKGSGNGGQKEKPTEKDKDAKKHVIRPEVFEGSLASGIGNAGEEGSNLPPIVNKE